MSPGSVKKDLTEALGLGLHQSAANSPVLQSYANGLFEGPASADCAEATGAASSASQGSFPSEGVISEGALSGSDSSGSDSAGSYSAGISPEIPRPRRLDWAGLPQDADLAGAGSSPDGPVRSIVDTGTMVVPEIAGLTPRSLIEAAFGSFGGNSPAAPARPATAGVAAEIAFPFNSPFRRHAAFGSECSDTDNGSDNDDGASDAASDGAIGRGADGEPSFSFGSPCRNAAFCPDGSGSDGDDPVLPERADGVFAAAAAAAADAAFSIPGIENEAPRSGALCHSPGSARKLSRGVGAFGRSCENAAFEGESSAGERGGAGVDPRFGHQNDALLDGVGGEAEGVKEAVTAAQRPFGFSILSNSEPSTSLLIDMSMLVKPTFENHETIQELQDTQIQY